MLGQGVGWIFCRSFPLWGLPIRVGSMGRSQEMRRGSRSAASLPACQTTTGSFLVGFLIMDISIIYIWLYIMDIGYIHYIWLYIMDIYNGWPSP